MQNCRKGGAYLARLFSFAGHSMANPAIQTASTQFALTWVQRSDDWWVVPQRQVRDAFAVGPLVQLPMGPRDGSWLLVLATRRHATSSPAERSFVEQMDALAEERLSDSEPIRRAVVEKDQSLARVVANGQRRNEKSRSLNDG